jgi:hypothetical protein
MTREAKMLISALLGMVLLVAFLYWTQNYECYTTEYQDTHGTHSQWECHKKLPDNCWSNYDTENAAIIGCEGE